MNHVGDLKFWWRNNLWEHEVFVPDVETALKIYDHYIKRDLEDPQVEWNYGDLLMWEEIEGRYDFYSWYDEDGNSFSETYEYAEIYGELE